MHIFDKYIVFFFNIVFFYIFGVDKKVLSLSFLQNLCQYNHVVIYLFIFIHRRFIHVA